MKKYIKPETVLVNISHMGIIATSTSLPLNDGLTGEDIVSDQNSVLSRENIWDVKW